MARRPVDLPEPSAEFIDDGFTDEERAAALAAWFEEFDRTPKVELPARAADTLVDLRAEGEI